MCVIDKCIAVGCSRVFIYHCLTITIKHVTTLIINDERKRNVNTDDLAGYIVIN